MRGINYLISGFLALAVIGGAAYVVRSHSSSFSFAEPDFEAVPEFETEPYAPREPFPGYSTWQRPEGPLRVGLQVGHWKNAELPEELSRLIGSTGAKGGGKSEWEVNMVIAEKLSALLQAEGITVDILPATIPEWYWADVVIAIHADGNPDSSTSGFKAAASRRDLSGRASELLSILERTYAEATGLPLDPNVTRNMRGYYAFNWRRYRHAVHPMATAVIFETGFLTSPKDRRIIVMRPELAAQGLANGILEFLQAGEPAVVAEGSY